MPESLTHRTDTLGVDKPSLFLTEADPKQTYLALTLDLEAPYPSASLLSPLLHWMQPGLKAGSIVEAWPLNSEEPALASFIPATPPPFSGPHKYLTLLYKQPEGFDPKEFGSMVTGRVKFDFEGFVDEAKLGDDSLVAAHHFLSN